MRFSANGLYIEEYLKCTNCGVLIYEAELPDSVTVEDKGLFCSQWCIDWMDAREKRKAESPRSGVSGNQ